MEDLLEFEISEKRTLSVFLEDKIIHLETYEDEDDVQIRIEGVFITSDIDVFWDNSEWITNDLVDHLFNGGSYPSVTEGFKEARFTPSDIVALKYLLTEGVKRGFFTNPSIDLTNSF
jgi:hypothetical protein